VERLSELFSEQELDQWMQDSLHSQEAEFLKQSSIEEYQTQTDLYRQYQRVLGIDHSEDLHILRKASEIEAKLREKIPNFDEALAKEMEKADSDKLKHVFNDKEDSEEEESLAKKLSDSESEGLDIYPQKNSNLPSEHLYAVAKYFTNFKQNMENQYGVYDSYDEFATTPEFLPNVDRIPFLKNLKKELDNEKAEKEWKRLNDESVSEDTEEEELKIDLESQRKWLKGNPKLTDPIDKAWAERDWTSSSSEDDSQGESSSSSESLTPEKDSRKVTQKAKKGQPVEELDPEVEEELNKYWDMSSENLSDDQKEANSSHSDQTKKSNN